MKVRSATPELMKKRVTRDGRAPAIRVTISIVRGRGRACGSPSSIGAASAGEGGRVPPRGARASRPSLRGASGRGRASGRASGRRAGSGWGAAARGAASGAAGSAGAAAGPYSTSTGPRRGGFGLSATARHLRSNGVLGQKDAPRAAPGHIRSPIRNSAARSMRICGGPSPGRMVFGAGAKSIAA